jgi:hypothetical protein
VTKARRSCKGSVWILDASRLVVLGRRLPKDEAGDDGEVIGGKPARGSVSDVYLPSLGLEAAQSAQLTGSRRGVNSVSHLVTAARGLIAGAATASQVAWVINGVRRHSSSFRPTVMHL